jgi:hypothetical protein
MLGASIGCGRAIGRTGRYRVFAVTGMAITTIVMLLLITLDERVSLTVVGAYAFLLGAGLGMVMPVLVVSVQNAVEYRDLGAATASATYFRSVGGSFGAVAFGAASAHADSVTAIFLSGAAIAFAGFVLAWFLRERSLRGTAGASASDLGQGYAAPSERSSRAEVERGLTLLMRRDPPPAELYEALAARAGYDLPAGTTWALVRVAREGRIAQERLARRVGVGVREGMWCTQPLLDRGMIERIGDDLVITPFGRQAAAEIVEVRKAALARHLAGWDRGRNPELATVVSKLSTGTVGDDADGRVLYGRVLHGRASPGR